MPPSLSLYRVLSTFLLIVFAGDLLFVQVVTGIKKGYFLTFHFDILLCLYSIIYSYILNHVAFHELFIKSLLAGVYRMCRLCTTDLGLET